MWNTLKAVKREAAIHERYQIDQQVRTWDIGFNLKLSSNKFDRRLLIKYVATVFAASEFSIETFYSKRSISISRPLCAQSRMAGLKQQTPDLFVEFLNDSITP